METSGTGPGRDNGIDHAKNCLRFPYDSTCLRSHDRHPHPYHHRAPVGSMRAPPDHRPDDSCAHGIVTRASEGPRPPGPQGGGPNPQCRRGAQKGGDGLRQRGEAAAAPLPLVSGGPVQIGCRALSVSFSLCVCVPPLGNHSRPIHAWRRATEGRVEICNCAQREAIDRIKIVHVRAYARMYVSARNDGLSAQVQWCLCYLTYVV
jgi:hypothetical protein